MELLTLLLRSMNVRAATDDETTRSSPLSYGMDQQAFGDANRPGETAARTAGLKTFIGAELEIGWVALSALEFRARLGALVDYTFKGGPVLEHGQRLQIGDGELFAIAHDRDRDGFVVRLTPVRGE